MKLFLRSRFTKNRIVLNPRQKYDIMMMCIENTPNALGFTQLLLFYSIKNTLIHSAIHFGKVLFKMCLKWLHKWREKICSLFEMSFYGG